MGVPLQSLRRIKIIMKRRKMHEWGLLMVGLIMSSQIGSGFAGREWPPVKTNKQQQQQQQIYQRQQNVASEYRSLQQLQQPETSRQADSGLLTTLISLGLRYGPTLFNLVMGGDEGGSPTSDKVSTDKIDNLDNQKEEDPLSTSNLISMAIKVALALFSSATSDGIDKSDVNTTQSILGIVISALTGSEDPGEVAVMAKQASEVVNMLIILVQVLQTSVF